MSTGSINSISKTANLILLIILTVTAIVCIAPIILVISTSVTDEMVLNELGYRFLPRKLSLAAYKNFIYNSQIIKSLKISVLVTGIGTFLAVITMSSLAYVLFRSSFKFRNQLAFFVFFTMLFRGGIVPSYMVNTNMLHLRDNFWILVLPFILNAFYVIVLRTFYQTTIPESIIESAVIDGSSEMSIFFRIVLPLSVPGISTVAFFTAIHYWNEWFISMLYIDNPDLMPIQYLLIKIQNNLEALANEVSEGAGSVTMSELPLLSTRMALSVVTFLPILIVYPFTQKYFVKGLTVGAVKG